MKTEKNELFITIKPKRYRDMVKNALEKSGYEITGGGMMMGAPDEGTGDIWAVPPPGAHPDEFGAAVPNK